MEGQLGNGTFRNSAVPVDVVVFAPAAVASGVVYAGDLAGTLHAVNLEDGKAKWTLNLGTDPEVKAPGMIYGGPVVQGGRLFVATCNLEGSQAGKATAVGYRSAG